MMTAGDPKATFGVNQELNVFRWLVSGVVALSLLGLAVLSASVWISPIAKFWYEPGFQDAVIGALDELPGSPDVCIYDDTRHMFVASVGSLDVDRMIEKAVGDNLPVPRTHQRDPHFRVYDGERTYYWSFKSGGFHAFVGDRFSLTETGSTLCAAFKKTPADYRYSFEQRNGIAVDKANFCCDLLDES